MKPTLTEFILKHEKFYNKLSKENKQIISSLDKYTNLPIYRTNNNEFYVYIGNKNNMMYLCKYKYFNEFKNEIITVENSDYYIPTSYYYQDFE